MADPAKNEIRFKFSAKGQGSATLDVVTLKGVEALSRLFRFELTLVSSSAEIDFDDILSQAATLTIFSHDGTKSVPYHGMVCEFEQLHQSGGYVFYRAVLVPRLWKLSLNRINEVYLGEQSILQVIEKVLQNNNLTTLDFQTILNSPSQYRLRSFVCQYDESSLDFISRWLEHEGVYYHFDHDALGIDAEKLIMLDYQQAQPADILRLRYTSKEDIQTAMQDDCVHSLSCKQRPMPQSVTVQDFNFRNAALADQLKGTAEVSANGHGEVLFYGDNLRETAEAEQLARIRAQELNCREQVFSGEATAIGLRCGHTMRLSLHYRSSFNGNYLITEVEHGGSQAGVLLSGVNTPFNTDKAGTFYECKFKAIPSTKQFRPERITSKPKIFGTLTATIDDEGSGTYAQVNQWGQYKVELMYDLSDKPTNKGSAWVRMATPYAGPRNGMHFPLLKGTEVLLGFMSGDPDQPVILGAVTNSENLNVVTDQNATYNGFVTAGANVMSANDTDGKQSMLFSTPQGGTAILIGALDG